MKAVDWRSHSSDMHVNMSKDAQQVELGACRASGKLAVRARACGKVVGGASRRRLANRQAPSRPLVGSGPLGV